MRDWHLIQFVVAEEPCINASQPHTANKVTRQLHKQILLDRDHENINRAWYLRTQYSKAKLL